LRLRRIVARFRRLELKRRNAHRLPGFEAVLGLRALAVHPHLAFANDALDMTERQARKPPLEKAIDAHAVLVRSDGYGLHAGRKLRGLWRGHWCRGRLKNDGLFARGPRGIVSTLAAIPLRRMLHAQIGLPGIGSLFG